VAQLRRKKDSTGCRQNPYETDWKGYKEMSEETVRIKAGSLTLEGLYNELPGDRVV